MAKKKTQVKAKSSKKENKHIVKRHGVSESYDEKKVYASVYAAALNAHYSEKKAEVLANDVMKKVSAWAKTEESVFSVEIRYRILKYIDDEDVSLMYTHHLDVC